MPPKTKDRYLHCTSGCGNVDTEVFLHMDTTKWEASIPCNLFLNDPDFNDYLSVYQHSRLIFHRASVDILQLCLQSCYKSEDPFNLRIVPEPNTCTRK